MKDILSLLKLFNKNLKNVQKKHKNSLIFLKGVVKLQQKKCLTLKNIKKLKKK